MRQRCRARDKAARRTEPRARTLPGAETTVSSRVLAAQSEGHSCTVEWLHQDVARGRARTVQAQRGDVARSGPDRRGRVNTLIKQVTDILLSSTCVMFTLCCSLLNVQ